MPKSKTRYDRDPNLPDEVNDVLELLLQTFEVPNRCWPHMRLSVAGWSGAQIGDVIAWASMKNSGPLHPAEPVHVFKLRQEFARIQGVDSNAIVRGAEGKLAI